MYVTRQDKLGELIVVKKGSRKECRDFVWNNEDKKYGLHTDADLIELLKAGWTIPSYKLNIETKIIERKIYSVVPE